MDVVVHLAMPVATAYQDAIGDVAERNDRGLLQDYDVVVCCMS